MGVWKKFNAIYAFTDYLLGQNLQVNVRPYKDINGNSFTNISAESSASTYYNAMVEVSRMVSLYEPLTAYPSVDSIDEFDVNDYAVKDTGTIINRTVNRTPSTTVGSVNVHTITVKNETAENIEINSIKFTKPIQHNNNTMATCLVYAYYLDDKVTLSPEETKTFTVTFATGSSV